MSHSVFVAAGSNIEPEAALTRALDELERRFGALRVSSAYRNTAVGFEGPDFINLVVGFETARPLVEVSGELHAVEALCGRPRDAPKWAPRAMDLDILLYGDLVVDEPGLRVPRADLLRRAYMLGPLAEIAPQVMHPVLKRRIGELWSEFDRQAHPLHRVELRRSGRRRPPGSGQ